MSTTTQKIRVALSLLILLSLALAAGCNGFFTAPVLDSITISPSTVASGSSVQLIATGTYNDGSTNTITSGLTWSSSTTTIATVNSTGTVTGVAAGTTTINVQSGTITGSVQFTVTNGTLTALSISYSPNVLSSTLGQVTATPTVTGTYSSGQTGVSISPSSLNWSSSNTSSVTVSTAGVLTEVAAAGTYVIISATDPTTGVVGTVEVLAD